MRCVLLCTLEAVEGELWLLEVMRRVLFCILELWRVGSVLLEALGVLEVPEVMR